MRIVIEEDPGAGGLAVANHARAAILAALQDYRPDNSMVTVIQPAKGRDQTPTPTRVSANKNDPGYAAWRAAGADNLATFIYLDGVEQRNAITADSSEGIVVRNVLSPDGNLVIDGDHILEETVHGAVVIEVRPQ